MYVPQKVVKGQALTDFLVDHPIPDDWELTDEIPDEDAMVFEVQSPWKMYFDGASYREGAALEWYSSLLKRRSCHIPSP